MILFAVIISLHVKDKAYGALLSEVNQYAPAPLNEAQARLKTTGY
jgi:hypothetical protein